jgi:hypothetical protein
MKQSNVYKEDLNSTTRRVAPGTHIEYVDPTIAGEKRAVSKRKEQKSKKLDDLRQKMNENNQIKVLRLLCMNVKSIDSEAKRNKTVSFFEHTAKRAADIIV